MGRGETSRLGVFVTTVVAFFLVEMGDKTQIATISLATRFHQVLMRVNQSTFGETFARTTMEWRDGTDSLRLPRLELRKDS